MKTLTHVELPSSLLALGAVLAPCLLIVPRDSISGVVLILLAACAVVFVGRYQPIVDRYLSFNPVRRRLLILGGSLLIALLTIGNGVFAQWWVMDDHELALILGDDHSIGWNEAIEQLAQHREVGEIGSYSRVRPVYYVIRYAESWLWGGNLFAWYAARVVAFAAIIALCWSLLWRWVGSVDSGVLLLLIFSFRMWADLWSRIGSSECYAMIGMAIALLGVVGLERITRRATRARTEQIIGRVLQPTCWIAVAFGTTIAAGCKENFLALIPFVVVYGCWAAAKGRLSRFGVAMISATVLFGGFLAWKILGSLSVQDGVDVYAKQRSVGSLSYAIVQSVTTHLGALMLIVIGGLAIAARKLRRDERYREFVPKIYVSMVSMAALLALFVSQFAFYESFHWFDNRYSFPAAIAVLLAVPLITQLWFSFCHYRGDDRKRIRISKHRVRIAMVLLLIGLGSSMQRRMNRHVTQSEHFTSQVKQIVAKCDQSPEVPVVFVSHGPRDFEALYSVERFLRYYGVSNEVFLRFNGGSETDSDPLCQVLSDQLELASDQGNEVFAPSAEISASQPVYEVGFSPPADEQGFIATF